VSAFSFGWFASWQLHKQAKIQLLAFIEKTISQGIAE